MKSTPQKLSIFMAVACAILVGVPFSKADIIVLSDSMDAPGNYLNFFQNSSDSMSNLDDISSQTFTGVGAGGNPGNWFQIFHDHDVDRDGMGAPVNGDGTTFVQSVFLENVTDYNPLTSGAFQTISFSLDVNFQASGGGVDFSQVFFTIGDLNGISAAGFTNINGQPGWQTITVTGLTSADFNNNRDFAGALDLNFGFGFTSFGDVTPGPESLNLGVDNFIVSVSAVPEPSSFLLIGSALILFVRRSRTGASNESIQ